MDFRHSVLIYNPASGRRRNVREKKVNEAREILSQWIPRVDLAPTSRRGHATELAAQALADGADLLVSCGGDGTINEVAGGMTGSDVPLLTLPVGTANVLAEEVEFPLSPEKAAALLPLLVAEKVPYGVVRYENPEPGARHFLLMCGVGVDASIVYHLNTRLKTYIGQGAYWLGSLEQLPSASSSPFRSASATKPTTARSRSSARAAATADASSSRLMHTCWPMSSRS